MNLQKSHKKEAVSSRLPVFLCLLGSLAFASGAAASETVYKVKIQNLTKGQVLSPPVLVAHPTGFRLFEREQKASLGVARLAEDGDTETIRREILNRLPGADVLVASSAIAPQRTVEFELSVHSQNLEFSFISMLASTNDTFVAVRGVGLTEGGVTKTALAYDSGTERNNELCDFIPGPPCGVHDIRDPEQGVVKVSPAPGILGHGDLDPSRFAWEDEVARVTISRVR